MRKALIIGCSGQDGSLLRQHLDMLEYDIIGVASSYTKHFNTGKKLDAVNILSPGEIFALISEFRPDEIYYLAAYHHSSSEKFTDNLSLTEYSFKINVTGFVNVLEACIRSHSRPKVFYASSSHIFAKTHTLKQTEETPFAPNNIYGITKIASMNFCDFYYNNYGIPCFSGILYNHESPLRNPKFVSKKIILTAIQISKGEAHSLMLGDIESRIDWGYAPEYVLAMHSMLQLDTPSSYIVSTGELHAVREFAEIAFDQLGLNWKDHVTIDQDLVRNERVELCGDHGKLTRDTGWSPLISFDEMVRVMVDSELEKQKNDRPV